MKKTVKAKLDPIGRYRTKDNIELCALPIRTHFGIRTRQIRITISDKPFPRAMLFVISYSRWFSFEWRRGDDGGCFYHSSEEFIRKFIFGPSRKRPKNVWVRVVADRTLRPGKIKHKPVKKH